MFLTPEQQAVGRRAFLKALAGTPAVAAFGTAVAMKGPVPGGPVRLGFIGVGGQGRALLRNADPAYGEIRALADINPTSLAAADTLIAERKLPAARHYTEWREMLDQEDLEAVVIATPLWSHAEIASGCLEARKHVLCEKMMAWDVAGCERMMQAAQKNDRLLEIGYQRRYSPVYQAAYDGVVKTGALGEIHHVRMVWHRNANWRRTGQPPTPDYDPSRWGYPTFEHLLNWRLYWKYSKGLFAELASHQVNAVNWFVGAKPTAVQACGGVHRFDDGREVYDHIYATFEYPGGCTATYSSVESNALENRYEVFFGTKATLILQNESEAMLLEEGSAQQPTGVQVSQRLDRAVIESSETKPAAAAGAAQAVTTGASDRPSATRLEISRFCSAIRTGTPLACGAEEALYSARACIHGNDAVARKTTLAV